MFLKKSDTTLDIAIWVDTAFAEVFFNGGRVAWTVPLPCEAIINGGGAAVFVASSTATAAPGGSRDGLAGERQRVELLSATMWDLNAVTYQDVGPDVTRT